jgi:hypothetical protein
MAFKPAIWYPIAVLLSVGNLVAVGFTAGPVHATIHAALALASGYGPTACGRVPAGASSRLGSKGAKSSKRSKPT